MDEAFALLPPGVTPKPLPEGAPEEAEPPRQRPPAEVVPDGLLLLRHRHGVLQRHGLLPLPSVICGWPGGRHGSRQLPDTASPRDLNKTKMTPQLRG